MVLTADPGLVVVTGAAGLVGRAVCANHRALGRPVRGLVRTLGIDTAARPEFLPVGELADASQAMLESALAGAQTVVHLAARVHRPASDADAGNARAAYRRDNVDVTLRLAHAAVAVGAQHFVFASTVKIHGESSLPGRPLRESDAPDPHDDYAASKWEAERRLAALAEEVGLAVTALRLPLTYGIGVGANFAALLSAVRRGLPLPFAAIDNRRSLLFAGNLASALDALLAAPEALARARLMPYLLADAQPVSTPELVDALAQALGVRARQFRVPVGMLRLAGACAGRAESIERLAGSLEVDTAAFRGRFHWTPPFTLAQGLAQTCAGVRPL